MSGYVESTQISNASKKPNSNHSRHHSDTSLFKVLGTNAVRENRTIQANTLNTDRGRHQTTHLPMPGMPTLGKLGFRGDTGRLSVRCRGPRVDHRKSGHHRPHCSEDRATRQAPAPTWSAPSENKCPL